MNTGIIDPLCGNEVERERELQRPDSRGRFVSKAEEALGLVDGGQLTRRVTDYVSPKGAGYLITFYFKKEGRDWRRVVSVGPETYRQATWFEEVKPKSR